MGAKQGPKETFKMSTLLVENAVTTATPVQQIIAAAADLAGTRRAAQSEWNKKFVEENLPKIFGEFEKLIKEAPFKKEYKIYYILDGISEEEIDLECINAAFTDADVITMADCHILVEFGTANDIFSVCKHCGIWITLTF